MHGTRISLALALLTLTCFGAGACSQTSHAPVTQPAMPTAAEQNDNALGLVWHDASEFQIEGVGWPNSDAPYRRLPARAQADVTPAVWNLSDNSAGIVIRFVTDSPRLGVIWDGGGAMNHMAASANSGLDLYARRDGAWHYSGTGRPRPTKTTAIVGKHLSDAPTEYLLYLPLYNPVTELRLGVEPETTITLPTDRPAAHAKPIVFYGTSITQGGCANRSGMCHPAILGRWLEQTVINLGFSGSGKMEPAMAHLLGEIDAAMYVLECLPNMTTEMVQTRVEPFVHLLRKARPDTPILLAESPLVIGNNPGNGALRVAYDNLRSAGVTGLHYLPGDGLLRGRENGTVDGIHPTDLGFYRMACGYEPVLRRILNAAP